MLRSRTPSSGRAHGTQGDVAPQLADVADTQSMASRLTGRFRPAAPS
jgi:hypothetical protein